jgi:hypothetical protein
VLQIRVVLFNAPLPQRFTDLGSGACDGEAGGGGRVGGLVSSRADADFKQLIEAVEQDQVIGRVCKTIIEKDGLVP